MARPRAAQCKERENEGLKTTKSVHCYTVWETTQIKHFLPLFNFFFLLRVFRVSRLCHNCVLSMSVPCRYKKTIFLAWTPTGHSGSCVVPILVSDINTLPILVCLCFTAYQWSPWSMQIWRYLTNFNKCLWQHIKYKIWTYTYKAVVSLGLKAFHKIEIFWNLY